MKKDVKKEVKKDVKNDIKKDIKKSEFITINIEKEKLFKGIGVVLSVIVVLGLAFVVSINSNKNSKAFKFINITVDEYLEKMKEENKSIIYIARPGCTWCQKESPLIRTIGGEYDLDIYYLNTDTLSREDGSYDKFTNSSEHYQGDWGTPNTIIVQNGKIVDGEFGYAEKDKLKDLFKRNGFINE